MNGRDQAGIPSTGLGSVGLAELTTFVILEKRGDCKREEDRPDNEKCHHATSLFGLLPPPIE